MQDLFVKETNARRCIGSDGHARARTKATRGRYQWGTHGSGVNLSMLNCDVMVLALWLGPFVRL